MNQYIVQHKIGTVAELMKPFEYEGYKFESWNIKEPWLATEWIVTKYIDANNAGEAFNIFYKGMVRIAERCSIISQCAIRIDPNSYILYRKNNNPKKIVYFRYVRSSGHVGLMFDDQEVAQISKFDNLSDREIGLFYMSTAANAGNYFGNIAMLIMAAEAFAGENAKTTKKGKLVYYTNHDALKIILGTTLYGKLYGKNSNIRNVLFHGKIRDRSIFSNLTVHELYFALMNYLQKNFNLEFEKNVVGPQRTHRGNYEESRNFWSFKNEPIVDLRALEDDMAERHKAEDLLQLNVEKSDTANY